MVVLLTAGTSFLLGLPRGGLVMTVVVPLRFELEALRDEDPAEEVML